MQIIKYLQLPFFFDADLLQQETDALSMMHWQPHYQVKHYEGEWNAIPLRSVDGKIDNIIISPEEKPNYVNTTFLDRSPYLQEVLQHFKCPLQAVRLLKLNAGSIIKEHRDAELNFEKGEIRLHVPVRTHADVEFVLDNERLDLKAGECWYMNFDLPHTINNKSNIDRIHLVVDALVNDWVKNIFTTADCVAKKEIEDTAGSLDAAATKQMISLLREMNTAVSNKMANAMENKSAPEP